jgi:hypothetical protein
LFFIFAIVASTAYSFKLVKNNKAKQAARLDIIASQTLLLYVILNIYFIAKEDAD